MAGNRRNWIPVPGAKSVDPALTDTQKADFKTFYGTEGVDAAKLKDTSYGDGAKWTPANGWE